MKMPLCSRRCDAGETTSDYHRSLIEATAGECVLKVLEEQLALVHDTASLTSADQVDQVHPPYGWTIRQVFAHCADAERVFGYRMLRLAAGDPSELADWDENFYADSRYGLGNLVRIVDELEHLRRANVLLLKRLCPECWDRRGRAAGVELTLRAAAWLTAGHLLHHLRIVRTRLKLSGNGQ